MHVLVIEDNAEDGFLILQAFATVENCHAYVCRTVAEARAYLSGDGLFLNRRKYPMPDGIVCDLGLGGESGIQFIEWLRSKNEFEHIPTFVLSGSPSQGDMATARSLGVLRVMQKPTELRVLERTLAQVTEQIRASTPDLAAA